MAITTDNASNCDTFFKELTTLLCAQVKYILHVWVKLIQQVIRKKMLNTSCHLGR